MKNNSLLRFITLFSILTVLSNCASDSGLEVLEETKKTETFQTKSNNPVNCNKEISVVFHYQPGANNAAKKVHRDTYAATMSQYFTICERYFGCDEEKWTVNAQEYLDFLNTYPTGTEDDDGGSSASPKPGCESWVLVSGQGLTPTDDRDTSDDDPGNEFLGW